MSKHLMSKKYFVLSAAVLLLQFAFLKQSFAQSHRYNFNNNFIELGGVGPALTEVFSCGAMNGSFGSTIITTTAGSCGTATAFSFNEGGGISYPNNTSYINDTYTINIFFQVNALAGYQRIIDFKNSTTDRGLYTLGDCLNFYPNGNVGACPFFTANKFYLISMVRDGATKLMTIYVNGTLFSTYTDAADDYVPTTTTTPILFFRDDNAVPCEDRDGVVKYIELKPTVSTAIEVGATWLSICNIALPVRSLQLSASCNNEKTQLLWRSVDEVNVKKYELEKSTDLVNFEKVFTVNAQNRIGENSYQFADNNNDLSSQKYYRVKMINIDGTFKYSSVSTVACGGNIKNIRLYPNPASDKLYVDFSTVQKNVTVSIFDASGKKILQQRFNNTANTTVNTRALKPGIYYLETDNGSQKSQAKFVKQ